MPKIKMERKKCNLSTLAKLNNTEKILLMGANNVSNSIIRPLALKNTVQVFPSFFVSGGVEALKAALERSNDSISFLNPLKPTSFFVFRRTKIKIIQCDILFASCSF